MELTIEQALQQAVKAHKAGRLQDAENLYRAILQAQPKHPDANHNLGVLAVSLNKSELALPLFKTALEANPNQGQFWLSYVDALIKEKQFDNARNVLAQGKKAGLTGEKVNAFESKLAINLLVTGSESSTNKITTYTQQVKKVSAKKEKKNQYLNQINLNQVRSPSQVDLNTLLEHYQTGRYDLTERLANDLAKKYPDHQFCWKVLGAVFKQTGRLQESLTANQRAVKISTNDAEAHFNLGVTLQELGRLEDAEASYKKTIEIMPDLAEAHYNLGNTQTELGRLEEAVTSYKKAIAIKPDYLEANSNLGVALQELGRLEEAETSYKKAIAIKPDYAEAHSNMGITLKELGRFEEAAKSYKKAIAFKPNLAEAHSNLGIALQELGRLQEAEASLIKAIAIKPEYSDAHSNLGITLQELGRLEEAEASYKKAIAIKPDFAEAHSNLGNTLKELGRLEEAEASLRKAIAIKPEYAEAHSNLGITLQELSRLEDASASFSQALAIKSDSYSGDASTPITALLPFGRSGSLFLHSLLDGHPEIATLPGVYFKGWFGIDRWQKFAPDLTKSDWRDRLVAKVIENYLPLFNANNKQNVAGKPLGNINWLAKSLGFMEMGPDRSHALIVDQGAFAEALLSYLRNFHAIDTRSCFELIHRAFEVGIRKNSGSGSQLNGSIFYHIHNPDTFELAHFLHHYPQARLLHLIRNPVQSMESWMLIDNFDNEDSEITSSDGKLEDSYRLSSWSKMVNKVASMFMQMRLDVNCFQGSRGVRLEDIKRDANTTMPQLASWMRVSDHPALYESSFCGLQYWGPSSKATGKITGFDKKAIDQPVGRLFGPKDVVIFETLFWPLSRLYRYSDLNAEGFHRQLKEIRPWLDEPLEFETLLYANLPDHTRRLKDLPQYRRLHRLLHLLWSVLDRDGTYQNMVQPLELDK